MGMSNIEALLLLVNQEKEANKGQLQQAPDRTTRYVKHYSILIGIGKDNTAEITLTEEALEALYRLTGRQGVKGEDSTENSPDPWDTDLYEQQQGNQPCGQLYDVPEPPYQEKVPLSYTKVRNLIQERTLSLYEEYYETGNSTSKEAIARTMAELFEMLSDIQHTLLTDNGII